VAGGNPRTVGVTAGQTSHAVFTVTCASTSGSIAISASTAGEDLDEDGYEIVVDGGVPTAIGINGSMTAGGLALGDHTVELQGEAFNCFAAGNNPRTVTVTAGAETPVSFDVTCKYHLYDRIAFMSNRTGEYSIYTVTLDGPSTERDLGLVGRFPAVSPDGLKIAFARNGDIWMADADGGNEVSLTSNADQEDRPGWSPDGAKIAYSRAGFIWIMDADGSNAASVGQEGWDPSWSPDGAQIAFMTTRDGDEEIFVMDADGTNLLNVSDHNWEDAEPAWSPLGNYIAFTSDRDGMYHIFMVAPTGGVVTNMTAALIAPDAQYPTWAPAATAGAFTSSAAGNPDIYYFIPGGGNPVRLTDHPLTDAFASWGGGN